MTVVSIYATAIDRQTEMRSTSAGSDTACCPVGVPPDEQTGPTGVRRIDGSARIQAPPGDSATARPSEIRLSVTGHYAGDLVCGHFAGGGRDHDPAPDFPVPVDPLDVVATASGLAAAPADLVRTDELIERLALIRPACSIGNVGGGAQRFGSAQPRADGGGHGGIAGDVGKASDRLSGQVSPPDAAAAATLLEHRASPEPLPRGYRQLPAHRSPLRRRPAATTTGPPKPL